MDFYRKFAAILILILITAAVVTLSALGQERKLGEYEVKAVFIYNLAKFIEWPDKSLDHSSTLTLYILGDDPFGTDLDAIRDKLIKGKRIVIKQIDSPDDLKNAGILFISSSEKEQPPGYPEAYIRLADSDRWRYEVLRSKRRDGQFLPRKQQDQI